MYKLPELSSTMAAGVVNLAEVPVAGLAPIPAVPAVLPAKVVTCPGGVVGTVPPVLTGVGKEEMAVPTGKT